MLKWTLSKDPQISNQQWEPRFGYRGHYSKDLEKNQKCSFCARFPRIKVLSPGKGPSDPPTGVPRCCRKPASLGNSDAPSRTCHI